MIQRPNSKEKRTLNSAWIVGISISSIVAFIVLQILIYNALGLSIRSNGAFQELEHEMLSRRRLEQERMSKWEADEKKRQKMGLHWDVPQAGPCTAHNTRDYKAQLLNTVPYMYNWLEPCSEIPIVIHGESMQANRCEISSDVSFITDSHREALISVLFGRT